MKTTRLVCDRCQNLIADTSTAGELKIKSLEFITGSSWDLCRECSRDLKDWLYKTGGAK